MRPKQPWTLLLVSLALTLAACDAGLTETVTTADGLTLEAQSWSDVCHRTESGDYRLITIADAAYETHVEHGDAGVGEAVPGMGDATFDENCEFVACPCFTTLDPTDYNGSGSGPGIENLFLFSGTIINQASACNVEAGCEVYEQNTCWLYESQTTTRFEEGITTAEVDACIAIILDVASQL